MATNYKKLPTVELGKLIATNDPNAMAEGQARGVLKGTQLQPGWQNIQPVQQANQVAQPIAPVQNIPNLQQQLRDAKLRKTIESFENAFQSQIGSIGAEQAGLGEQERKQQAQIGVSDTMARKASQNILARQGLSASGAASQSDIAQNVITQSARGQSSEQFNNLRADIQRRLTEAKAKKDFGVAQAQADSDILGLEQQMQAQATADAQGLISQEQTASTERGDFLNTIDRFSADFQAEIDRVLNDNDKSNDWKVGYLQAARQSKIASQGLDQQGRPLPVAPEQPKAIADNVLLDIWEAIGTANQSIADRFGIAVGARYSEYQKPTAPKATGVSTVNQPLW